MKASALLAPLLVLSASACSQAPRHAREQTSFNLGDKNAVVDQPVPLSNTELAALSKDGLMLRELDQDPRIAQVTGQGLAATVVHLGSRSERDLIIVGVSAPFLGANVGPFWVIRCLPSGPRVVFHALSSSVSVGHARTNGLRDLTIFKANGVVSAETMYRFNGKTYRVSTLTTASMR